MNRIPGRGWLRAAGTAALAFAAILVAAPAPSNAASYTLAYSGTVQFATDALAAMGLGPGATVDGTITIDPFNTDVFIPSATANTFQQPSVAFTFHFSVAGAELTLSDSDQPAPDYNGSVVTSFSDATQTGMAFDLLGEKSYLLLRYRTSATNEALLTSLATLPNTASGLIALFGGTSPRAFGEFSYGGVGTVLFDIIVPATTPIPAALPLFASALGGLGFAAWRRRVARRTDGNTRAAKGALSA
jgi:hypothetical protein